MKKIIPLSLIAASALFASSISLNQGWNLVGAIDDIAPDNIGCAKTVWTYDNSMGWSLYQTIDVTQNYGMPSLSYITQGQGFWVNTDCTDATIEFTDVNTTSDQNTTDVNTTYDSNTSAIDFSNFTMQPVTTKIFSFPATGLTKTSYNVYMDDGDEYDKITIDEYGNISLTYYENDGTWTPDMAETGSVVIDPTDSTKASVTMSDGFSMNITKTSTQQVTAIGTTQYTDLYITDMEMNVTASGSGWTDTWDWVNPTYYDGTAEVAITNVDQLITAYTTTNMSIMDGNFLEPNGTVTIGNYTGTDIYGYDMYERTTTVLSGATWTKNTVNNTLDMNFPQEMESLSVVFDGTDYTIQSQGYDKVGSIWHAKKFTGADASDALIQSLLQE